jgi:hypothetical protein
MNIDYHIRWVVPPFGKCVRIGMVHARSSFSSTSVLISTQLVTRRPDVMRVCVEWIEPRAELSFCCLEKTKSLTDMSQLVGSGYFQIIRKQLWRVPLLLGFFLSRVCINSCPATAAVLPSRFLRRHHSLLHCKRRHS